MRPGGRCAAFVTASAALIAGCSHGPRPSARAEVVAAPVDAGAPSRSDEDAGSAASSRAEPPIDAGWMTIDFKTGRVSSVGRDAALAVMRESRLRVLVQITSILEECSSTGGTHVFALPVLSEERPFTTAHMGGHGIKIPHEASTLLAAPGPLFVAAVEVHPWGSFGNGRGFCLETAPAFDADIIALVPVRSEGEGMRLLTELAH